MEKLNSKQLVIRNNISNHYLNFAKRGQQSMTCELAQTRKDRLDLL